MFFFLENIKVIFKKKIIFDSNIYLKSLKNINFKKLKIFKMLFKHRNKDNLSILSRVVSGWDRSIIMDIKGVKGCCWRVVSGWDKSIIIDIKGVKGCC